MTRAVTILTQVPPRRRLRRVVARSGHVNAALAVPASAVAARRGRPAADHRQTTLTHHM